ncbi:putative aldolase [Verrucomicrobia bacterium]|nr:putative aldolase [Verrucomicrobiota bacterium]
MNIGKQIRMNRIFAHPSGRLCSVAVDHFVGYGKLTTGGGLSNLSAALAKIALGGPGAVTMSKGTAINCWAPYAGKIPLIIQSGCFTADDRIIEVVTDAEECVRLGADAIAVAIGIFGPNEGRFIKMLMDQVCKAAQYDLPVIAHIYPRDFSGPAPRITFDPEGIMWAARVGIEAGVDVIKVGYTGDPESFRQVVESSPVPVVVAGGLKAKNLRESLSAMAGAIKAGCRGATIGRNVWGVARTAEALRAFKAVILEGNRVDDALKAEELTGDE